MTEQRKIEIFSAGCGVCKSAIEEIRAASCDSCEVTVLDMQDSQVSSRATALGVKSLPAVVIDGKLADCCAAGGVNMDTLRTAGLGQPLG